MKNAKLYLKDIIDSINKIEEFVEGMTFEEFQNDDKTSSAVLRKFEIMGEAAKLIPKDIKIKHSNIPWKEMAGMRDKLIHSYSKVDFKLVWTTIKERIPRVKSLINKINEETEEINHNFLKGE